MLEFFYVFRGFRGCITLESTKRKIEILGYGMCSVSKTVLAISETGSDVLRDLVPFVQFKKREVHP